MNTTTVLIGQSQEPLLVEAAPDGAGALPAGAPWLVLLHAAGENRTGNNYWAAQTARALAAEAGVVVARFDLSGYGESLADKDVKLWRAQRDEAVATARARGAATVHVLARGLHVALLSGCDADGQRVALYPVDAQRLAWWRGRPRADEATVEVPTPPDAEEERFWQACGVDTDANSGLCLPVGLVDALVGELEQVDPAAPPWTVAIEPARSRKPRSGRFVCGHEPLGRLEADRIALAGLLRHILCGSE